MVSSSEVRVACPSVSFFFARLGATLGITGDFFPLVGDFIFEGCGLSVVLGELSACSLPSAGDCSNIILGVPRSNHKEQGKFKDNIIK